MSRPLRSELTGPSSILPLRLHAGVQADTEFTPGVCAQTLPAPASPQHPVSDEHLACSDSAHSTERDLRAALGDPGAACLEHHLQSAC